jgi:hypothetical protein
MRTEYCVVKVEDIRAFEAPAVAERLCARKNKASWTGNGAGLLSLDGIPSPIEVCELMAGASGNMDVPEREQLIDLDNETLRGYELWVAPVQALIESGDVRWGNDLEDAHLAAVATLLERPDFGTAHTENEPEVPTAFVMARIDTEEGHGLGTSIFIFRPALIRSVWAPFTVYRDLAVRVSEAYSANLRRQLHELKRAEKTPS